MAERSLLDLVSVLLHRLVLVTMAKTRSRPLVWLLRWPDSARRHISVRMTMYFKQEAQSQAASKSAFSTSPTIMSCGYAPCPRQWAAGLYGHDTSKKVSPDSLPLPSRSTYDSPLPCSFVACLCHRYLVLRCFSVASSMGGRSGQPLRRVAVAAPPDLPD